MAQSDRNLIINDLLRLLEENIDTRLYKLDISSFYESIAPEVIIDSLYNDAAVPRPTQRLLSELFSELKAKGIQGLPRGLSLSATLSELYVRNFDRRISLHPEVFYYNRFVDDTVIITSAREEKGDFVQHVKNTLPQGLELNPKKTLVSDLLHLKKTMV